MAKESGSVCTQKLQVSRCSRETGRQRYRIPKQKPVPFALNRTNPALGLPVHEEAQDLDDGIQVAPDIQAVQQIIAVLTESGVAFDGDDIELDSEDEEEDDNDDNELVADGSISDADESDVPDSDSDSDLPEGSNAPRVSEWRLNLTALSQRYNLYFVAYRGQIHVSRPRCCITNRLPSSPDLILAPGPSDEAVRVGGYVSRAVPHQVNQLITGEFGEEEVLLLAYDDGDVIGYYARHIEQWLDRRRDSSTGLQSTRLILPFFHENVGMSAWGLAVHKTSRLIAAGSNLHEATVFIPALRGKEKDPSPQPAQVGSDLYQTFRKSAEGDIYELSGEGAVNYADPYSLSLVFQRVRNSKIVMETGGQGHNIPNLTFSDDEHGNADKIVAVDVFGNIWLMDIWNFHNYRLAGIPRLPGISSFCPYWVCDHKRVKSIQAGWGVVVLPESSFLLTEDLEDSLGLPGEQALVSPGKPKGNWIWVDRNNNKMPQRGIVHPWLRGRPSEEIQANVRQEDRYLLMADYPWKHHDEYPNCSHFEKAGRESGDHAPSDRPPSNLILKDGSSILRTYETDIELRSFEEGGWGIMHQYATRQVRPLEPHLPRARYLLERLSNIQHVPELSLVIGGSMCGRVVLITPTRPRDDPMGFKRGFRIEGILPTVEEEDEGLRPMCALYGISVAPVPAASKPDLSRPTEPRYRLMIHYYDLTILSYELTRNHTNDLVLY